MSLVRKSKKLYYSNLDEKKVTDNKTFWKTIKPFLSDKIASREKVTLTEEDEIAEGDINTAQIFNTFFSNIVSKLKIAEYANCDIKLRKTKLYFLSKKNCCKFFLYLGFLSRTFTIHRTAVESGGYLFNSPLPLPPASQTLRY